MKIIKIPKKRGQYRLIYKPNKKEKLVLRTIAKQLEKKVRGLNKDEVIHGFIRYTSPVTNASQHVSHKYSLSFDLENFFDCVKPEMVTKYLTKEELALCFVDGAARQGLPTSPHIANLAAITLDKAILNLREKKEIQFIYTRYADDLTFSYDDEELTAVLKAAVPQIVGRCGFKVNRRKTKLQSSQFGRRIITGIAVDDEVHPTRAVKRKLRAAKHQAKTEVVRGLEEWCKLKPPRQNIKPQVEDELASLCKAFALPKVKTELLVDKGEDIIEDDYLITSDPAYTLGMSKFTIGWTSCMASQYRKGTLFWLYLKGTRVACLLSNKTKVLGVERRVMRARALVHELRNGTKCYDRIYGNPQDVPLLRDWLTLQGYISVAQACRGVKVIGNVPKKYRPYLDNLKRGEGILNKKKVNYVYV